MRRAPRSSPPRAGTRTAPERRSPTVRIDARSTSVRTRGNAHRVPRPGSGRPPGAATGRPSPTQSSSAVARTPKTPAAPSRTPGRTVADVERRRAGDSTAALTGRLLSMVDLPRLGRSRDARRGTGIGARSPTIVGGTRSRSPSASAIARARAVPHPPRSTPRNERSSRGGSIVTAPAGSGCAHRWLTHLDSERAACRD